jgi:O-acetyl-ADP-ribose deacetylase
MKNNRIEIIFGDITKQSFDAIVNAANKSLLAGGGVDGAIHRAAGPELEEECKELGECTIGQAKITKSYRLSERKISYIIHAIGPRWLDGTNNEGELLRSAYQNSLKLAVNYKQAYKRQCLEVLNKYIVDLPEEKRNNYIEEASLAVEEYTEAHSIKTITFPSISTGIYRFPLDKAANIAISTIKSFLDEHKEIEKVAIVCFDEKTLDAYSNELNKIVFYK